MSVLLTSLTCVPCRSHHRLTPRVIVADTDCHTAARHSTIMLQESAECAARHFRGFLPRKGGPPTPQKLESLFFSIFFAAVNLAVLGHIMGLVNVHIDSASFFFMATLQHTTARTTRRTTHIHTNISNRHTNRATHHKDKTCTSCSWRRAATACARVEVGQMFLNLVL